MTVVVLLLLCGGCGQESEAVRLFKSTKIKAEQGDTWSQHDLGEMYRDGEGVPQDYVEAAKWYRRAAEQGNAWAQGNLGWMYFFGYGVPRDNIEANKWIRKAAEKGVPHDVLKEVWYEKAAEQGNARAQFELGRMYYMYYHSVGGVPDYGKAAKWFQKAAEQGDVHAQFLLGTLYYDGEGVPKNDIEAAKWFRKAAEQGFTETQLYLGLIYAEGGGGVPKNDIEAYAWFLLAKANGEEVVGERIYTHEELWEDTSSLTWNKLGEKISALEKRLTAEQMEKGQARAAELRRLIKQKSAE